uniref:Uncharacterized protein n=1 Tax=Arundo donax TaxID=35708 RepID=A0A0A9GY90_ARUDO
MVKSPSSLVISQISLIELNASKLHLRTELESFLVETHNLTMLEYFTESNHID